MGEVKCYSVHSNGQRLDGGAMFGNAPKAVWQRWAPPDELGRIELACRTLLVDFAGTRVLFETGIGAFFSPEMAKRYGVQQPTKHLLLKNLQALGVTEQDIDMVVLSHLHFDHAGGLLSAYSDAAPSHLLFPNAQYVVGAQAWSRALHPHSRDRASFIPELTTLLADSGRLKVIEHPDTETLLDGQIRFLQTEGHTPGQLHAVIKGHEETIVFAGDIIPGTPWVHLPITMGYDRFPEKVIDEKLALYQKIIDDRWIIFYTHDTKVAASRLIRDEKGKYTPIDPVQELAGMLL